MFWMDGDVVIDGSGMDLGISEIVIIARYLFELNYSLMLLCLDSMSYCWLL